MAKYDPSESPPPYYSVAVHTQPPLKPHEQVVYGETRDLRGSSPLNFIPQHPPPVAAPRVTQPAAFPSSKRRPCWKRLEYVWASVGLLLLLLLLAIAIWLGVRYGTRLAPNPTHYAVERPEEDGHSAQDFSSPRFDTCPNTTVLCDGVRECQLGSDETNCVRFAQNGALQVRTTQDGRFLPLCDQGWNHTLANRICSQMGFGSNAFSSKVVDAVNSFGLMLTNRSSPTIQGQVEVSPSCPEQKAVSLQCVDCGRQSSTSRIIGGTTAELGHWPWQLSLHLMGSHTCGGVLIAPQYVLSAAHCFEGSTLSRSALLAKNWDLYAGVVSLKNLPEALKVQKIIINENYNVTNDQDVALLKLSQPVQFNDTVRPACLPTSDQIFGAGTECYVTGFGTTEEGAAKASTELKEVAVKIIRTDVCNSSAVYAGRVSRYMLCAGDLKGGKDSCQGDSGGPLMCRSTDNRWRLAGITSWGVGCGRRNRPGVYAQVTAMLPWIYSKMQQEQL